MNRATGLTTVGVSVLVSIVGIALVTSAFTPREKDTIQVLRGRIVALEELTTQQAQEIGSIQDSIDGIVGDLGTLGENDAVLSEGIATIDIGLQGLVAADGPIAQIDENLLYTQGIVFDNHPQIALTDVNPLVVCDVSTCTVDIEWTSEPPATGQLEWGPTPALGTFTTKEESLLGYHKQRIGQLPADGATYYVRITAEVPETGASASVDLTAELS